MSVTANGGIEVVLFDIGGVVVDVNDFTKLLTGSGITDTESFHERWLMCPAVRSFESGRCDVATFAASTIEDLNLEITPGAFLDAFNRWPRGVFPGIKNLIRETRDAVTVGCLSNTNTLHWNAFIPHLEPETLFHHQFLSFEIGLLKPDAEIYAHASQVIGVAPGNILFLDDNRLNIEAAREAGYCAELVSSVAESRNALQCHEVL